MPPLNSYVVDDGWVDYDKDFWCFNDKFPNELYESSALSKKFSSEFGLWLGPRGGYNLKTDKFGRRMERSARAAITGRAAMCALPITDTQKMCLSFSLIIWKNLISTIGSLTVFC